MHKILFFTEIFLLFIIFSECINLNSLGFELDNKINLILKALLFTLVVFMVYSVNKFNLTDDIVDNFYFELTPEKVCDGGPYMWSSNPEKQKFCSQFAQQDLNNFECSRGYHGRPVMQPGYIPSIPAVTDVGSPTDSSQTFSPQNLEEQKYIGTV